MKKVSRARRSSEEADELRPEYSFDYTKAKPNPFAADLKEKTVAVVLDPDVAEAFPTTDSVNAALRVLAAVARRAKTPRKTSPRGAAAGPRSRTAG